MIKIGLSAQPDISLSGYIQDATSHEALRQAQIFDLQTSNGVLSNEYGYFSLSLPVGTHDIVLRYSFYQADTLSIYLQADTQIIFFLEPYLELEAVEITDHIPLEKQVEMSTHDLPIQQIKRLPAILGEVDVLKAVQLMPQELLPDQIQEVHVQQPIVFTILQPKQIGYFQIKASYISALI